MKFTLIFTCKHFDELTVGELYDILKLRQKVFIVEQTCLYLDIDDKDLSSFHLSGYTEHGKLICYSRLIPEGISYPDYASIGRVVSDPEFRRNGAGKELMHASIKKCEKLFPDKPIKIGAQTYLKAFYESYGFETVGQGYIEDGIPHIIMVRT
ncbi:MAG: GNAT family N-acetyltransferase [Saprospiraceae bacterium]|nr:MAG: N-acetyltransferase GCN5 [Bacteroidetes bacterium OLB9]MCO6464136.1 GNAT family N-acetyltransferase [Saprospiraceae bacterium]